MAERQSKEDTLRQILEDEFTLSVIGSNQVKKKPFLYGELGMAAADAAYTDAMNGEEAQKRRAVVYDKKKRAGDQLGVHGEPAFPTNYDLSLEVASAVNESMSELPLGLLENIVKGVADGLEVEVPDKLKMIKYDELMDKVGPKGDLSKLNEKERDALQLFNLLKQAYEHGAALKATQSNYFADLNKAGKEIAESYK